MKLPSWSRPAGRVVVISLGCAKNLVDSEHLVACLLESGFTITSRLEGADLMLINTCAFIAEAREESAAVIRDACRLKRQGGCRAVIVAGCMVQRYRRALGVSFSEVDAWIGLDDLDRIGEVGRRVLRGERAIFEVGAVSRRLFESGPLRVILTGGPYAYLKIAEGCSHRCRFCAIPAIRGSFRSRSVSSLLREAEQLITRGIQEINLIAQDTTGYGRDRRDGTDLVRLLRALDRVSGDFWVRILYGYPTGVSDALLEAVGESRHVLPYFDIPIQHSDPDVLRAMGRAATVEAVAHLTARIRSRLPKATIRTTCLVGHPGESPKAFERLVFHVQEAGYDHLGVFVFSPEEGTPAAGMKPCPSRRTGEWRRERLLAVQAPIARARVRGRQGDVEEMLVEEIRPGRLLGRCRAQAPEVDGKTWVAGSFSHIRPGARIRIRLTGRYRSADWEAECLER